MSCFLLRPGRRQVLDGRRITERGGGRHVDAAEAAAKASAAAGSEAVGPGTRAMASPHGGHPRKAGAPAGPGPSAGAGAAAGGAAAAQGGIRKRRAGGAADLGAPEEKKKRKAGGERSAERGRGGVGMARQEDLLGANEPLPPPELAAGTLRTKNKKNSVKQSRGDVGGGGESHVGLLGALKPLPPPERAAASPAAAAPAGTVQADNRKKRGSRKEETGAEAGAAAVQLRAVAGSGLDPGAAPQQRAPPVVGVFQVRHWPKILLHLLTFFGGGFSLLLAVVGT